MEPNQFDQFNKFNADFIRQINDYAKSESAPALSALLKQFATLPKHVSLASIPAFENLLEVSREFSDRISQETVRSTLVFARGGWSTIPLRNMGFRTMVKFVKEMESEPDEEVKKALDQAIPEYFRRDDYARLSEIVSAWSAHFPTHRQQVFDDALWAHRHGRYTLSMPTLAAQVEGALRDLAQETGGNPKEWKSRFNERFAFTYDSKSPPTIPRSEELLPKINQMSQESRLKKIEELRSFCKLLMINELFKSGDFSNPEFASEVNRHVILHGVRHEFVEVDSLKLFFILDVLHEAVGTYKRLT